MAEILIFNKFAYLFLLLGTFPIIAQASHDPLNLLSSIIVILLMILTILPQIMLISKPYRDGLIEGIQDADGKTNREDLRYFASWAIPVLAFQTLVFINLFSMVSDRPVSTTFTYALSAIVTGSVLSKLIKGDKKE